MPPTRRPKSECRLIIEAMDKFLLLESNIVFINVNNNMQQK